MQISAYEVTVPKVDSRPILLVLGDVEMLSLALSEQVEEATTSHLVSLLETIPSVHLHFDFSAAEPKIAAPFDSLRYPVHYVSLHDPDCYEGLPGEEEEEAVAATTPWSTKGVDVSKCRAGRPESDRQTHRRLTTYGRRRIEFEIENSSKSRISSSHLWTLMRWSMQ